MSRDTLQLKYGVSRGRNTYGYRIISLYVNGKKAHSCNGGGYSMDGTVLGQYLGSNFKEKLKTLRANYGSLDDGTGYYGLVFHKGTERLKEYVDGAEVWCSGACGWSAMVRIAEAIGVKIEYITEDVYIATY